MAPKLIGKYKRDELEKKLKPAIVALAREERDDGRLKGVHATLTRPKGEIIDSLMRIKFTPPVETVAEADKPSDSSQGAVGTAVGSLARADEEVASLELRLAKARLAAQEEKAKVDSIDVKGAKVKSLDDDKVKLVPPSRLDEPVDKAAFRVWRLEVATWLNMYSGMYSGPALLQCMLTVLGTKTKAAAFDQVAVGALTLEALLAKLDRSHGGNATLRERCSLKAYRACKRGAAVSLIDFLVTHEEMRTSAIVQGVLQPGPQDSWDLLDACMLSGTQRCGVLDGIARERRTLEALALEVHGMVIPSAPTTYRQMYESLEVLGYALAHGDGEGKTTATKEAGHEALFSAKGKKGDRKGRKGAEKGAKQAKFEGECFTCGKFGHRSVDCFKNKGAQKGPKGKGKGKGKSEGKGEKKKDWTCPKCSAHVFGSREKCFKSGCDGARPPHEHGA